MALLIRIAAGAALVWFVWRVFGPLLGVSAEALGGGGARRQCTDCAHRVKEYDDGVICRFGRSETFKNDAHIANCHSWQKRGSA